MPKIIKNLREQLLQEAKAQICEHGYSAVTVRSVAAGCGVGIGTLYNYFPSKDMMIASFMLEDWNVLLANIEADTGKAEQILPALYSGLQRFLAEYHNVFTDKDATKVFRTVIAERHVQLRDQLASLLWPVCENVNLPNKRFAADFLAEAILTWSVAGVEFSTLSPIINCILKNTNI